jgi:hypothetical protein
MQLYQTPVIQIHKEYIVVTLQIPLEEGKGLSLIIRVSSLLSGLGYNPSSQISGSLL